MNTEIIKEKLEQALPLDVCIVKGDSGTFQVIAVSDLFIDMTNYHCLFPHLIRK